MEFFDQKFQFPGIMYYRLKLLIIIYLKHRTKKDQIQKINRARIETLDLIVSGKSWKKPCPGLFDFELLFFQFYPDMKNAMNRPRRTSTKSEKKIKVVDKAKDDKQATSLNILPAKDKQSINFTSIYINGSSDFVRNVSEMGFQVSI